MEAAKKGGGVKLAILAVVAIASVAALYVIGTKVFKPADAPQPAAVSAGAAGYAALAVGHMKRLTTESAGKPGPSLAFVDGAGKTLTLADFKGKPVLVNLWATWCAPCKKEMPTLAALQKQYEGRLQVVALSIDTASATDAAKAFIAENAPLAFYQDATMKIPFAFSPPAQGFPTTILYDANGVEQARLVAEADWNAPEAHKVVAKLLGE